MSARLIGGDDLRRKLETLQPKVFKRVLSGAGRKATKPVILQSRQDVPVESGQLRKSLGLKVRTYKATGVMAFIVGARSGHRIIWKGRPRDPVYYSHLVELGHGTVPPVPFLEPSLTQNESLIIDTLGRALGAGIEKEAKRA